MHLLPSELLDRIFSLVATGTADSRHAILPLLPTSRRIYEHAKRSTFTSLCLLQCTPAKIATFSSPAHHEHTRNVRRLLLSFKDLDTTPSDDTVPALLRATSRLSSLVLYLCESGVCSGLLQAIFDLRLRQLDYGSFSSIVTLSFDDLLRLVRWSRDLRKVTWEVVVPAEVLDRATSEESDSALESLSISTTTITDAALLALVDSCRSTLRSFRLRTSILSPLLTHQGLVVALSHCPRLETLCLDLAILPTSTSTFPCDPVQAVLPTCPRLKFLELAGGAPLATLEGLARIDHGTLAHLSLKGIEMSPGVVLSVARTMRAFTRLETLDLELAPDAAGFELERVMQKAWADRAVDVLMSRRGCRAVDPTR